MEYCSGGDLGKYINQVKYNNEYIEEKEIWKLLYEISSALSECHNHSPKIIHRDIKPGNIFIVSKNFKLGDFVLAREINEGNAKSLVGTPLYVAPEVISKDYDEKCDIWGLGCTAYEMATLHPPFIISEEGTIFDLLKKIQCDDIKEDSQLHHQYSKDLFDLVKSMLDKKASKRPSAETIMKVSQTHFYAV